MHQTYIYVELALEQIKSADKGMYFLSYLKIRFKASERGGTFTEEMFREETELNSRTAKTHIKKLIENKFVIEKSKGVYQIIAQDKLFTHKRKRERFFKVDRNFIFSFNWKNISSFRANLCELIFTRSKDKQKPLFQEHSYKIDPRSKAREKVKNERQLEPAYHPLFSLSYGKCITGLSIATLSKYRSKQQFSKYVRNFFWVYNVDNCLQSKTVISMIESFKGKAFKIGQKIYYSGISSRFSSMTLNRHSLGAGSLGILSKESTFQTMQTA